MNIRKRKRPDYENSNQQIWTEIRDLIFSLMKTEKSELHRLYEGKFEEMHHEVLTLKKINMALEYKTDYYVSEFNQLKKAYDDALKEMQSKIDNVYCVSCGDCDSIHILCEHGHANCKDCLSIGIKSYITDQNKNTRVPSCLKCCYPLTEEQLSSVLDPLLWGEFCKERIRVDIFNSKEEEEEISNRNVCKTVKRPCCGKPIVDFEGCAALSCEFCENIHYCAFCFKKFSTERDCHIHVSNCTLNPDETYHIISEEQIGVLRQCWGNRLLAQLATELEFDLPEPVVLELDA
jgi:hypothetical protein